MKRLYVYADFDWLKEVELIGELGYESLRGSDSYSFSIDKDWLRSHGALFLSDDLNNYPGQQHTLPGRDILGVFRMHCPTGGDVPCCCAVNRLQRQKRSGR